MGDERLFNPKLFVRRDLVEQRLQWLRANGFTPLTLDEAVRGLSCGEPWPHLPVVLTLDDGWYSSAEHVIGPALRAGFPISLYLASEVMQRGHPVLDVSLRYILWRAGSVQADLDGLPGLQNARYDLGDPAVRESLVDALTEGLRALDDAAAVVSAMERLATQVGVQPAELALASRRFSYLSGRELQDLQRDGCDIQLHGHAHLYPKGQPEALRLDLERCRAAIVGLGLPEPVHYCYPSGEFDARAPSLLACFGVASATTCAPGLVAPGASALAYMLPRFLDGEDVMAIEFEAEMSGVLEFARRLRRRLRGGLEGAMV